MPHTSRTPVRVRFAPSPTGHLHIGGLRSALFNWLFARHHGGAFLLRIEDTDQQRSSQEYTATIHEALRWAQLDVDEPVVVQSQRIELYQEYFHTLYQAGYVFWSPAEQEQQQQGVYRFSVPRSWYRVSFYDEVRGTVSWPVEEIDDFPLARSDGSPLYNFVAVVDDIEMRISHVIRGEDHIANTPRQLLIYYALGASLPVFAHVPLIVGPSGKRLSKRDAATSTLAYRDRGFLPHALCNYMVRLGWSHYDQEVFTRDELIQYFSLAGINKSAATFDYDKLLWINSEHMQRMKPDDIVSYITCELDTTWYSKLFRWSQEQVTAAVALYQTRDATLTALQHHVMDLHHRPEYGDIPEAVSWSDMTTTYLHEVIQRLYALSDWTVPAIKQCIKDICTEHRIKLPIIAKPLRFALTGMSESPSVFDLIYVLGVDETAHRIRTLTTQYPA